MAGSFESLCAVCARTRVKRSCESLLDPRLGLDDIVIAEWLWAASERVRSGIAIIAVVWVLGVSREATLVLVLPVVALTGLVFGAIGLCVNALAQGYDFFTYYFTLVLTPMTFLSGVYYPVAELPGWLAAVAGALPLAAAVELARPLVLGRLPEAPLLPLATLLAYAGGALYLAMILTRRRFAS